jgi:imidazolonepropionase-like amidohydrolase
LDKREALKGVTIYPAQIFGIDDKIGSLEKGKIANIVLADGDILEMSTNIKHVFIEGKEADLSSVYTELLDKYKNRNN